MTRFHDRDIALKLREQGKSYSQIKNELKISKSTLSEWLKTYPLTKEQINALSGKNELRIERYRMTMKLKREDRWAKQLEIQKNLLLPLSDREKYIAGLFLYCGEGTKGDNCTVCLNNTDPDVMKFFLSWMTEYVHIQREKIKVSIHLYSDMNVEKSLNYWSKVLNLPISQFIKPYIKKNNRISISQKGYGHGTCGLYIYDIGIKTKIISGLKAIIDQS